MTRPPAGPVAAAARLTWGALGGFALDDADRARLAQGLGGVVLFERNVVSAEQLGALTASIRAVAPGPVRISMDQEGGHVIRAGDGIATRFPGPMALAATGSVRLARAVAAATGRELRALGLDTVLAPVVDVAAVLESAAVGVRAFGDEPGLVARFGAAMVRGYLEGGVVPVPKHLPGHGRTGEDSHVSQAVVRGSMDALARLDLPPFAAAVAAGAPAMMAGHVVCEALDAAAPASLAAATASLARGRLRFDGLLVTDALVMDAITERVTLEEAGVLALAAGMDAAMAIEGQRRVLDGLAAGIADGRVSAHRVAEALGRAAALERTAAGLPGTPLGAPLPGAALERHAALAREVAERSLVLMGDEADMLPLDGRSSVLVVDVTGVGRSPIEGAAGSTGGGGARLARSFARARVLELDRTDAAALLAAEAAVAAARDADVVVLLTRDAFAGPMDGLPDRLAATGRPLVHVALRNPLDLGPPREGRAGTPTARIAAWADTPATLDAVALALLGRIPFRGRLPVRLPSARHPIDALEMPA
ncbi:MAG TPA: glycoside hydrolase family 3 N-terminal domain-containing protein [Candidatus Limnocylindrales bacterium]|nr:glycoside hydrolase family 3 N-terminal domain-containing protein [Candidatus Limnocylindrales bacterium]